MPDALEQELIDDVLAWLKTSASKLQAARGAAGPPRGRSY